ncbi:penicillin-binding transpeptidase domain-containing protein, partial [Candidatus Neomarinimicrobiota bacterium]
MKTSPSSIIFRRNFLAILIIGLLGIIGIRFFIYQILLHDRYSVYAENNSIRSVRLPAPRGYILDRDGDFIVSNRLQYSLAVIPAEVRNSIDKLEQLYQYLDIPRELIRNTINDADGIYARFQPVTLHDDVSFIQRSKIEEHRLEFPGIFFVTHAIRHYPSRARATHVLGYLRDVAQATDFDYVTAGYNPGDLVGSAGLELQLESILRGEDGYRFHLVDNLLRDLGDIERKPTQYPASGDTVWLTLDVDLQAELELMMEGIRGALIAMDPYTGEILAYVSAPDYVLAPFIGPIPITLWEQWRDDPGKVLLNRGINGLYPPGSTYKLISAAAVLASSNIDPEETIVCTGAYQYGNRVFHCNIWSGHGEVNLEDALRESCNIYFYMKIQEIGFDNWAAMSKAFGFGEITGIELPNESKGLVPTPD